MTIPFFVFISTSSFHAQTTIWSEDFDGNGGAGSNWGLLNQNIGIQGMTANLWYISCLENGNASGICGSGCGADNSLHVGSSSVGDIGAAYDASSLCLPGCFLCDLIGFCSDVTTNKRTQSANISTAGQTNLTYNFNYIENGQGTIDDCIAEYSIDGGTTWIQLGNPAKTVICGSGQGLWTALSYVLPAAAEGIANLRVAFRWQNNADGLGTDPSFAVDDITITTPTPLPVELFSFYGKVEDDYTRIFWATASEINNDYFLLEKRSEKNEWDAIARVNGKGTSQEESWYQFEDLLAGNDEYYRLKQVDFDGKYSYSSIIHLSKSLNARFTFYPNPAKNVLIVESNSFQKTVKTITIQDVSGRIVHQSKLKEERINRIDISNLLPSFYTVIILEAGKIVHREKIVTN
tara:strand:+ start:1002 stop:2219 length:1218 start_codon:yes stop_codon:yes gene_type:complete